MNYQNTGLSVFLVFALSGTSLAMKPELEKNQPINPVDFFLMFEKQPNVIEQPPVQHQRKKNQNNSQKINGLKNVQQKPAQQALVAQKQEEVKKNQLLPNKKQQLNKPAFDAKTSDEKPWNRQRLVAQVQTQQIVEKVPTQNQVTNVAVEKPVKVPKEAKTVVQQEQKVQPQVSKNNAKKNSGQKSVLSMSNGQKKLWQVFKKNVQILNAKGMQNKSAFDKRVPNKKPKSQQQQVRSVKKQQAIVQKKVAKPVIDSDNVVKEQKNKNLVEIRCCVDENCKQAGVYYRDQDGQLKTVAASIRSKNGLSMVKNHLAQLNYFGCLKKNTADICHNFSESLEKQSGNLAYVFIKSKDYNKITDDSERLRLYITMPGRIDTIKNEDGKPYIINNKLGVFEFKVRKSLYEEEGLCYHRFFNPRGKVGAEGFGAKERAKEQKKLTKGLLTDI